MKIKKSKQSKLSKQLVSTSMENISNKIDSTLISYVKDWNRIYLGLIISYLGIDSNETKEALKDFESRRLNKSFKVQNYLISQVI